MKSSQSMSRQIMSDCLKLAFNNAFILNIDKINDLRKPTKHHHSFIVNITKFPGIKLKKKLFTKTYIQTTSSRVDTGIGLCFFRILITNENVLLVWSHNMYF